VCTYLEEGERLYDHAEVAEPIERIVARAPSNSSSRGHRTAPCRSRVRPTQPTDLYIATEKKHCQIATDKKMREGIGIDVEKKSTAASAARGGGDMHGYKSPGSPARWAL
jgi:hypothetical protein